MNSIWDAWNIKFSNERTTDDLAIQLYQEHFCIAAILEAFMEGQELEFKQINEYVFMVVPSDFLDMSVTRFNLVLAKMIRLGYLIYEVKSEKQKFAITTLGVEMWQQQTFQMLAASSFFSYQSHKLNRTSVTMNKWVLILTGLSILIAVLSLIIAVLALSKS